MIISRRAGALYLVEQHEHARLAGEMARAWGNERFAAPEPLDATCDAAAWHDAGWRDPDAQPLFNRAERRPLHFLEIERREHAVLYRRGVDEAFASDPYVGLLVSMHWTGLYRSRWGLAPSMPVFAGDPVLDEAVAAEQRRWIAAKDGMDASPRGDLERGLWHNYELLQAWDQLSLFVCHAEIAPAADDDAPLLPVAATLRSVDREPGPRSVQEVPTSPGAERVELVLRPVEPGVVTVDPYPFATDEVAWSVRAHAIPDRPYDSEADVRAAFAAAEEVTIACRMTRR